MIRGTTPTVEFTLPFLLSNVDKIWITFSQNNSELFTLEKQDCELYEYTIQATLTQKQTLKLLSQTMVEIQVRLLTKTGVAMASNIIKEPVQRILKDGEI